MNFNPTKNWQATDPIWEKFKRNPLLDQIHVIRVNVPKNIETISEVKNLLSASELEKLNRIVRQQDKDTFLVSNLMKKILNLLNNYLSKLYSKQKIALILKIIFNLGYKFKPESKPYLQALLTLILTWKL